MAQEFRQARNMSNKQKREEVEVSMQHLQNYV